MATYSITHHQRVDGVAVIQTLTATDVAVGQSVTVAGLGHSLNGTHTVSAVPGFYFLGVDQQGDLLFDYTIPITNQILFLDAGDDLERSPADPYGTLTYTLSCTWVTSAMVTEFLGIATATANDTAYIATCVAAANAYCYRKRQEAGYFDSLSTVPSNDVKLGATIYAASLYRERGSIDGYQSFNDMAIGAAPMASMGRVMQLLGCNRSQVA